MPEESQWTRRTLVACQHLFPIEAKKGMEVAGKTLAQCIPGLQPFSFINQQNTISASQAGFFACPGALWVCSVVKWWGE